MAAKTLVAKGWAKEIATQSGIAAGSGSSKTAFAEVSAPPGKLPLTTGVVVGQTPCSRCSKLIAFMARAFKQRVCTLLGIALVSYGQFALSQAASGVVDGRVTCNDGNVPARGAKVQLIPLARLLPNESSADNSSQDSPTTSTDFSGVYSFPSVEPGTYIVNATMAGYEDDFGLARATLARYTPEQQKSIVAAFSQVIIKAGGGAHQNLILRRSGAIFGRVSVDSGGTVPQSRVTATLVGNDTASSGGSVEHFDFSQSAFTDDRGAYRISGLPPGSYRVSVHVSEKFFGTKLGGPDKVTVVPQRTGLADLTVFVPEVLTSSGATLIKVADGDEATSVDISIPTRSLHSLGGTVTRGGEPLPGVSLSLEIEGKRVIQSDALSMPNGSFQFDLLPDGNYSIVAKTYNSGKATSSTKISVQLHGSDATDLMLDLPKGVAK